MKVSARRFAPVKRAVFGRAARAGEGLRKALPWVALLPILVVLASCHKSSPVTSPVSVVVAPTGTTLNVGMTAQFGAAVSGGTQNTVTWAVNGVAGGNSTVGTIQLNGSGAPTLSGSGSTLTFTNYVAPATLPSNPQITISAISVDDTTIIGTATLTLLAPAVVTVSPQPTPATPLAAGGQIPFSATVCLRRTRTLFGK